MCLWFFKMLSDFFSFVFRYNICALSDLKKRNILTKASYVLRCDKRFKKRKGNLQILWCFFRRLKNYETKCCKMSRQPAETSKTCGNKFHPKRDT